jgi:hypothetical protein
MANATGAPDDAATRSLPRARAESCYCAGVSGSAQMRIAIMLCAPCTRIAVPAGTGPLAKG